MPSQGYDPLNPQGPSQGGLFINQSGGGLTLGPVDTGDYNSNAYALWQFGLRGNLPDGTQYISDIESLRNWILAREMNRKIENLANVKIDRPVKNGDTLQFDADQNEWVLVDFISGGTW
jgi:hypothetical protein